MRYYLYVSKAKVDMLFDQISDSMLKEVATEFKLDFKVLSARQTTTTEFKVNDISRLEVVTEAIRRDADQIGTINRPRSFVEGSMDMTWGILDDQIVYFTGTKRSTSVRLVGSARHVQGSPVEQKRPAWGSHTPMVADFLARNRSLPNDSATVEENMLSAVSDLEAAGPPQYLEFMAKTLFYGSRSSGVGNKLLLATPLYVALAD